MTKDYKVTFAHVWGSEFASGWNVALYIYESKTMNCFNIKFFLRSKTTILIMETALIPEVKFYSIILKNSWYGTFAYIYICIYNNRNHNNKIN